ncbi:potassium channel family protein [Rhodovibrio salinarum]|nr:potassium channel family protein [Rhodovibrio salinarum]
MTLGAGLLALCVGLHAIVLDTVAVRLKRWVTRHTVRPKGPRRFSILVQAGVAAFLSHILQIWIWALAFLWVGEFDTMEPALYFSTASFTTVGYGDVTASPHWRLLGSFEAAAGMLLFGLSTAFLFEVMRTIWRNAD